jgi:hypothetical protein
MLRKEILFCDQPAVIACDGNCRKAWGIDKRPKVQISDNEDDYAYLADGELGEAPIDPGTYAGDEAKPTDYDDPNRLNRWCARECERNYLSSPGCHRDPVKLPDLSRRFYNIPTRAFTWTASPPTVPGWYWARLDGRTKVVRVGFLPGEDALSVIELGLISSPSNFSAFAGPIPEPKDA